MSIQDVVSKIISVFSPQKLVSYIVELVEEINSLKTEVKKLKEQNQAWQDEVNRLKGEKGKPEFKKKEPSGNKHLPGNKKELGESKGREKNKKTGKLQRLNITSEQVVPDSRIKRKKGYKDIIIQDISYCIQNLPDLLDRHISLIVTAKNECNDIWTKVFAFISRRKICFHIPPN